MGSDGAVRILVVHARRPFASTVPAETVVDGLRSAFAPEGHRVDFLDLPVLTDDAEVLARNLLALGCFDIGRSSTYEEIDLVIALDPCAFVVEHPRKHLWALAAPELSTSGRAAAVLRSGISTRGRRRTTRVRGELWATTGETAGRVERVLGVPIEVRSLPTSCGAGSEDRSPPEAWRNIGTLWGLTVGRTGPSRRPREKTTANAP